MSSFYTNINANAKLGDQLIGEALRKRWNFFQLYQHCVRQLGHNAGVEMFISQILCKFSSIKLADYLAAVGLPEGVSMEKFSEDFYNPNFVLRFEEQNNREAIRFSVVFPTDACGNRPMDFEGYTRNPAEYTMTIETALLGDRGLLYKEEWGYEDIRRFYSNQDLLKEVQRLAENPLVQDASDEDASDDDE